MEIILLIIFLGLIVFLCLLIWNQGKIQVKPLTVAVRRNRITGRIEELTSEKELHFFIPGLEYIYQVVKCQKIVHDPENIKVTTRDGQEVEVDYIITYWPNYFDDQGNPKEEKKGNIKKLATTLEPEKIVSSIEDYAYAAIQRMFSNMDSYSLLKEKDRKGISVVCPYCHTEFPIKDEDCPNKDCLTNSEDKKVKKDVPGGFYNKLSWSAGVRLHNFLGDHYGLGCWLEIQTVIYKGELERAARAETMGKMEGLATKARLGHETTAVKKLIEDTKVNPNMGLLVAKFSESLPEIIGIILGKKKGGSPND